MNYCTHEPWTLKQIYESLSKGYDGKKKIVIPMFQRGKRWNKATEDTFIDSLKNNYPIGTLLFYKTFNGQQEIYTLIDGLQRGTTIRKYLSNPTSFFQLSQIPSEALEKIYSMSVAGGNIDFQKEKINSLIVEYIRSLKSFDDFESGELFMKISGEFPVLSAKLSDFISIIKPIFKTIKDEYNSLCNVTIPAIIYTGDENTLPYIFERINSKGTPLTEYEIYSASWPSARFVVNNINIVEKVLAKYDALNDNNYDLSDYNRDVMRTSKLLNAFEYVFGLSKYICDKYDALKFYNNQKADETNPIAFQLLNACFNSSHGQIKDVHSIITKYSTKIDKLESALIDSIDFVIKCISPILKFKGNTRNAKTKILHSQYQIMSLISFVFRKKYNENLEINENWRDAKEILKSNIWKYYVYDILTKYWGEGGTGKIHTANSENRYFVSISKGQFSSAYDNYHEDCLLRSEKKQVPNPIDKDYVILNTIYLQTFTAMDQLSLDNFDVEHIATKDQLKKLIELTEGEGLPISHIANLCYLPEFENRSKGANNFYQDTSYLNKSDNSSISIEQKLENIEKKFSFTTKENLEWMDLEYTPSDYNELKVFYLDFLSVRSKVVKEKFLSALGFSNEEFVSSSVDTNISNVFDDKFFRLEKIGVLIRKSFEYLLVNNLLTTDDIFNLKDKEYCLQYLGCAYPVLSENANNLTDSNGRLRFWKEPIVANSKSYYISKEWYEHDRKIVVPWIKEKMGM